MSIKIEQKLLQAALEMAGRFAGKTQVPTHKDPVEIIHLIFTTDSLVQDVLVIQAWNDVSGISLTVPFSGLIEEERAYTLPAAALIGAVSRAEDALITLSFEKTGLVIKSQAGKSVLRDTELEDQRLSAELKTFPLGLVGCQFKAAIEMVSFAAYPKAERYPINGVRFEFGEELTLVATDGIRLAKYAVKTGKVFDGNLAFTVPLESVTRIAQTLGKVESPVEIGVDNGRMAIKWEGGYLFSLLVEANYPNYRVLVPKTCKTKLTFGEGLSRAIKTARVIAREACAPALPVVFLRVNGDGDALVETEVEDVGKSTISLKPMIEGGGEVQVGFNVNLLPLSLIADHAVMGINACNTPVMLKNADPNWMCILMPVVG